MSIATKTGDHGMTALMFNRRVPKTHPRIEACGTVDELNAALGLARASAVSAFVRESLLLVQKELVLAMGELASATEDLQRYRESGFGTLTFNSTARLDHLIAQIEVQQPDFHGWATPGATLPAAALDVARATCRRAERRVCALPDAQACHRELLTYLNRLSDLLWLLARWTEAPGPSDATAPNPFPPAP